MRWTGGRDRGDNYRRASEYLETLIEELELVERAINPRSEEERAVALIALEISDEDLDEYGDAFDVWFGTSIMETLIVGPRREDDDTDDCRCDFGCVEDHDHDGDCEEGTGASHDCPYHCTRLRFLRTVGGPRGEFIYRTNAERIVEVAASHGGPMLSQDIVADAVAARMRSLLETLLILDRQEKGRINA